MESSIFYHEDFYRQVELIPEENYFAASHYAKTISKENEYSEYGFYTITARKEQPIKILSKEIPFDDFSKTISPLAIKFFDTVESGFSNAVYKKQNTVAWGFEKLSVFVEYANNSKYITNLWLCDSPMLTDNSSGEKFLTTLNVVGKTYKLILIDWNQELIIRLSSIDIIKKYLEEFYGFTLH